MNHNERCLHEEDVLHRQPETLNCHSAYRLHWGPGAAGEHSRCNLQGNHDHQSIDDGGRWPTIKHDLPKRRRRNNSLCRFTSLDWAVDNLMY